jgi:hypothetical protein
MSGYLHHFANRSFRNAATGSILPILFYGNLVEDSYANQDVHLTEESRLAAEVNTEYRASFL